MRTGLRSVARTHLGKARIAAALLVLGTSLAACGSRPIPLSARAGTTFVLTIPISFWTGLSGFGRAAQQAFGPASTDPGDFTTGLPTAAEVPFDATSGLEDPQRGELAVKLYSSTHAFWLPVRYVTRVHSSPASDAGIDGRFLESGLKVGPYDVETSQEGQVVALIDIPVDVPPGDYSFRPATIRRDANGDFQTIRVAPSWGSAGSDTLTVLPADQGPGVAPAAYTPLEAIFNQVQVPESVTREQLRSLVPNPALRAIFFAGDPPAVARPAAATLSFEYPDGVVEIADVVPAGISGSGSIIRWHTEQIEGEPAGCGRRARLVVHSVDPDEQTASIAIVFRLRDPFGACPGIAAPGDFALLSSAGYDLDGAPLEGFAANLYDIY